MRLRRILAGAESYSKSVNLARWNTRPPATIGIVHGSLHFDEKGRGMSACSPVISLDFMLAFDRIHVFRAGRMQFFRGEI